MSSWHCPSVTGKWDRAPLSDQFEGHWTWPASAGGWVGSQAKTLGQVSTLRPIPVGREAHVAVAPILDKRKFYWTERGPGDPSPESSLS